MALCVKLEGAKKAVAELAGFCCKLLAAHGKKSTGFSALTLRNNDDLENQFEETQCLAFIVTENRSSFDAASHLTALHIWQHNSNFLRKIIVKTSA